jgi:hypothetical protein
MLFNVLSFYFWRREKIMVPMYQNRASNKSVNWLVNNLGEYKLSHEDRKKLEGICENTASIKALNCKYGKLLSES